MRWGLMMAAVLLAAGATTGCSSEAEESSMAEEWQRDYCTKLGSWQDVRDGRIRPGTDPDPAALGRLAVLAAGVLEREGVQPTGAHLVDDTKMALLGDAKSEGRAVTYCGDAGFETLVG
ncbi:hypothetical protein ABZO31_01375 [Streptomyces sp. HUAS MG47]|uniref:hypothetical protein n=1 Tax=Streptomyces solicamelliae TaxID=3231716 RepID=UPI003877EFBA